MCGGNRLKCLVNVGSENKGNVEAAQSDGARLVGSDGGILTDGLRQ